METIFNVQQAWLIGFDFLSSIKIFIWFNTVSLEKQNQTKPTQMS